MYSGKSRYVEDTASQYDSVRFSLVKDRLFVDRREGAAVVRFALDRCGPGASILDVACGTGRISQHLLDASFQVTGVDISNDMLAIANNKLSGYANLIGLEQGDAERLPFDDGSFSCVVCCRLFGHLPNEVKSQVLSELVRVSQGTVILGFPRRNVLTVLKSFFDFRFKANWYEFRKPNWHSMSLRQFKKLLRAQGLEILATKAVVPVLSTTVVLLIRPKQ